MASTTDIKVQASRALVTVQPRSRAGFELPKDRDKLNKEKLAEGEELLMGLSADLRIKGPDSVRLANSTQNFFREMLDTLEQSSLRSSMTRRSSTESNAAEEEHSRNLARAFHQNLTTAFMNQPPSMMRSPSNVALMADFSNVESLLQHGVEPYIAAARKLLRANVRELQVDVALHRYNFSAFDTTSLEGHDERLARRKETVGGKCVDLFCGLCICAGGLLKKLRTSSARTEPSEPLLSRSSSGGDGSGYVHILKDVTCLVKPGRLTLVLGPPGSGKTSLLKAMSGQLLRTPGKTLTTGELTYNGQPVSSLKHLPNWVAYASQNDEHMPFLTVRETLTHAFKCRKEIRFTDEKLKEKVRALHGQDALDRLMTFKNLDIDVALAVLGLTRCADTVIGNETLKGISGGERRRVTLGEMLAVGTQVLCLDEISTGLDSAATFDICQYLRHVAHIMDQCVVVALLQPPPEVMNLFDDVLVIAEGSIIYHGERAKMMEYFESLGFRCPPRKDVGDFLQELPTKSGLAFQLSAQELKELGIPKPPSTPTEFAARWKQSEMFKNEDAQVRQSMSRFNMSQGNKEGFDIDELPENPWYRQLSLAISWMWGLRLKDKVKYRAKLVQNVVMGLLFGTLFWQIPKDEAYQKNILFLQVLMFAAQTAIPEVQANAQARSIYHKHIDQGFYKAWMLAFAQTFTSLPFVILDTVIYGQLIYWMTGLSKDVKHFALFCAIATLFGATMQSIMGVFPYIIRDQNKAAIAAVMVFITSVLMSGVIATAGVIPFYLRPLFDVNPLAWAFRTMANIEFLSPGYDENPCTVTLNGHEVHVPQRCGDFFMSSREISVGWKYVWAGMAISASYLVVFWFITAIALTFVRFDPLRGKKKTDHGDEDEVDGFQTLARQSTNSDNAAPGMLRRQQSLLAEEVSLVVHELGYSIKSPTEKGGRVDLLKNISCFALPGRMLALMGASGAGKTTLLDVLAGIKTVGKARGTIFLNGKPMRHSEFTRLAGYVQQFGTHSMTSTVRESLEFSLALRLPADILPTPEERRIYMEKTLDLLELDDIQEQLAGQCTMEQNKRLTLGVELVANPSIVFADEPTSSLDARAASIVMRVLQKVARSGRIVIATIHQPSIAIFQRFDDLLLLKKGGQVVFFGELGQESRNLIQYFEAIPGVTPCPDGANPAAWMLEVIGGGTGIRKQAQRAATVPLARAAAAVSAGVIGNGESTAQAGEATAEAVDDDDDDEDDVERQDETDFAAVYRNSKLRRTNDEKIRSEFGIAQEFLDGTLQTTSGISTGKDAGNYKTSTSNQFRWLLYRNFTELWRSPDFSFLRFVVIALFALMFVAIFFQQQVENMPDVQSRVLCITFSMSLASMFTMMTIIPFSINRRALFYRERGAGMYSSAIFSSAAGVSEVPYLAVSAALIVNIVYFGVGFNKKAFPYEYFFVMSFTYLLMMAFVGMLMASLFPEPLSAQLAASAFFSIMNTFAGISVPVNRMPKPYVWLHYFSPLRWYFEGILSTQFYGDDQIICNPIGKPVEGNGPIAKTMKKLCTQTGAPDFNQITGVQTTVEDFVLHDFLDGFKYERRWEDFAILVGWIVGLRILAVLATTYISFDKR